MLPSQKKPKGYLSKPRQEAQRLGRNALLTGVGSVAMYWMLGGLSLIGPLVGVAGLGLTAYQTWKWLSFRGEWGLRF